MKSKSIEQFPGHIETIAPYWRLEVRILSTQLYLKP